MMKKLVVLSLVVALGTISSAALVLVDLGGGQFGVEGPANENITWYLGVSASLDGRDVAFTERVKDRGLSAISSYGTMDWASVGQGQLGVNGTWELKIASGPTTPTDAGILVTGMTNAAGFGTKDMGLGGLFLLDGQYQPAGALYAVPEPMSLMLLGLGGLFLRRRK